MVSVAFAGSLQQRQVGQIVPRWTTDVKLGLSRGRGQETSLRGLLFVNESTFQDLSNSRKLGNPASLILLKLLSDLDQLGRPQFFLSRCQYGSFVSLKVVFCRLLNFGKARPQLVLLSGLHLSLPIGLVFREILQCDCGSVRGRGLSQSADVFRF